MPTPVHILILEDRPLDAELMVQQLRRAGFAPDWQRVETEADYLAHLDPAPEIILADYSLPQFDGLRALQRLRDRGLDIPFIIVSGSAGEDLAVQCMTEGAADYLLKDRLARLGPAVAHALQEKRLRDDKRAAEEALRQRNLELQARNEELDAFAHTVAHELKNPLHLIVGHVSLVANHWRQMPDEERAQSLADMARIAYRMDGAIEDLLLLSQVRRAEVQQEPLDMAHIVAAAVQHLGSMIETHHAQVVLPPAWPVAWGYGAWVEEVWVNCISNAVKYGGRPPRVELGADVQADAMVRFWVHDNGPGMPEGHPARRFAALTEFDPANVKGHGLGLSIVRRIVERLGGQVGVQSQAGNGSTFHFTLMGFTPADPASAGRSSSPAEAGPSSSPAEAGRSSSPAEAGRSSSPAEAGRSSSPAEAGRSSRAGQSTSPAEAGQSTSTASGEYD